MLSLLLALLTAAAAAQAPSPVDTLTKLLADKPEAVQADFTERLFGFMWSTAKDSTYVPAKRRAKDKTLPNRLKASVEAWVKAHAGSGEAASVFYVLGAGDKLPSWAQDDAVLKGSLGGYRKDDFIKKMSPWTEDSSGLPGQLSKKHAAEWPAAFLTDAASQARRFLDHRPVVDDAAFDQEGKRLSGQRELPSGEVELMRFNKARELTHPPAKEVLKNVKEAVKVRPNAPPSDDGGKQP